MKVMAAASVWGYGPLPELVGRIGLMLSSLGALNGHHALGDSIVPPIVVFLLLGSLFWLDDKEADDKGNSKED
jgi:hypothetical protein